MHLILLKKNVFSLDYFFSIKDDNHFLKFKFIFERTNGQHKSNILNKEFQR